MDQGLRIEQTQGLQQVQTITLQQVQLSHMLELPVSDLAERIDNEVLDNPALEKVADEEFADTQENGDYDELDDYGSPDEVPEYLLERAEQGRNRRRNDNDFDGDYAFVADSQSAYDLLVEQIHERDLDEKERKIL